jgi:lipoyl-dependent peroxiredoxin
MIRKAKAVWRGTDRAGSGNLSTDSGVLAETPYSFRTRFENEKGTNPEELIAAAHAGCFTMRLAFQLQRAGYTPSELNTEAAVTLEPEGRRIRISRSAPTLRAQVPNMNDPTGQSKRRLLLHARTPAREGWHSSANAAAAP